MFLQKYLYGAESLVLYVSEVFIMLNIFLYILITPENLVCSLFCKGGFDPLVWVHLLCHSLDHGQWNPCQCHHYKKFPSHCFMASSESRTVKYRLPSKESIKVRFLCFHPHCSSEVQWRAGLSTSVLWFNESHFCSSLQLGVHGQEHTQRFAGFQVKEISILLGLPKAKCRKESVCAWGVFGFPDLVGPDHFLNNIYFHILQRCLIWSEHLGVLGKKKNN